MKSQVEPWPIKPVVLDLLCVVSVIFQVFETCLKTFLPRVPNPLGYTWDFGFGLVGPSLQGPQGSILGSLCHSVPALAIWGPSRGDLGVGAA